MGHGVVLDQRLRVVLVPRLQDEGVVLHDAVDGIARVQEWQGGGSTTWLAVGSHGELRQRLDEANEVTTFLATDIGEQRQGRGLDGVRDGTIVATFVKARCHGMVRPGRVAEVVTTMSSGGRE